MPIKSIVPKIIISAMLGVLSTSSMAIQIKCPSADFIKKTFVKKLNRVTRIDTNKFTVTYWDILPDEYNQYWSIEVFVDTAHDRDFNDALKQAKDELLNTIARPNQPYLEFEDSYCIYVDKNGNPANTLAFHENKKEERETPSLSFSSKHEQQ